jgi:hypothetical protein
MLVRVSVAVTVAPGTAAPLASVMFPRSVPVTACALAVDGIASTPASIATTPHASNGRGVLE